MNDEKIMFEDDRAAEFRTVRGWVSRDGRFFGDGENAEYLARWAGCDLIRCKECGAPIEKRGYTVCPECREKKERADYLSMPVREWDGKSMIYSLELDVFFGGLDEAEEEAATNNMDVGDLRLVLCEPVYFRELEPEFFLDDLPEFSCLPDDILVKIEELNEVTRKYGPVAWEPGKYRVHIGADCNQE